MGIPRFASYLHPYSSYTTLGYKNSPCDDNNGDIVHSPKFIVDGPALAYHIYYRLVHRSHATGAFDALPSYHQIGQATIAFLSELEAHHVQISHVYFDGHLPLHKRPVRLGRLQSCLKDLIKIQTKHPKGLALSNSHYVSSSPLTSSQLFDSSHSLHSSLHGLPAPPFLVPAVLDELSQTKYASITEVVPGEADTFCAKATKDEGGMILTSDSDMLVYDIGDKNAVVFFTGLEIREDPNTTRVSSVLKANVYPTAQIAKRLEVPSLLLLAYHCKSDPTLSLSQARRRMLQPVQDASLWQRFKEAYAIKDLDGISSAQSLGIEQRSFLDPRLSELILQLSAAPGNGAINIYLPFLVDDPSRASAWYVSSFIRQIIYDLVAARAATIQAALPLPTIVEFSRRGLGTVPSVVSPLPSSHPIAEQKYICDIHTLSFRLRDAKARFRTISTMFQYRIFALRESYRWYIINSKNPPSRKSIAPTMTGHLGSLVQWEDIHLDAQICSVLYALRMVKQFLGYITVEKSGREGIVELQDTLEDLPPLSGLLPSFVEMKELAEKEKIEISQIVSYIMLFEEAEDHSEAGSNTEAIEKG
ncbi:MAG: hypothetical protein Q9204_002487 [Flavoplaca sp. TL-2023a]